MSKYDEKAARSLLYAQVRELPVNAVQRALAVDTLRSAEKIAGRIMWVMNGLRRVAARAGTNAGGMTHAH